MTNKIITTIVVIIIIVGIGYLVYQLIPKTEELTEKEQGCINSGGEVSTSSCCEATGDFPNLCLVGPCTCAPENSHQVKVCDCGPDKCFNGSECVSPETGEKDITEPEAVPNDLEIEYGWGACHADWGWNTLIINSDGDADLKLTRDLFRKQNQYNFINEELSEIYGEIVKNNFFELEEEYYDPNVIDGSCSNLRIKAEGKEYKVSIANKDVKQIERITQKIFEILDLKDSDWETLDEEEICRNAKLTCETEDNFQGVSCDVWNQGCEEIQ